MTWKCETCGNTNVSGSVKGKWYCGKHWKDADNKALHEDYPQYYNKNGIGHPYKIGEV